MSPRNSTIGEVLEAVQVVQAQGRQTDLRLTAVVKAVETQGQQMTRLHETLSKRVDSQFTEALEAVHLLATQMEKRFSIFNGRFDSLEGRFDTLEGRFDTLEGRVERVESQMVTKTYLDDKLADLRGDLTLLTHKEDDKLIALVDLLYGKRLMTETERQHIMALQPFAVT
jgi:predicted nuclease with TOPRIM domain